MDLQTLLQNTWDHAGWFERGMFLIGFLGLFPHLAAPLAALVVTPLALLGRLVAWCDKVGRLRQQERRRAQELQRARALARMVRHRQRAAAFFSRLRQRHRAS